MFHIRGHELNNNVRSTYIGEGMNITLHVCVRVRRTTRGVKVRATLLNCLRIVICICVWM